MYVVLLRFHNCLIPNKTYIMTRIQYYTACMHTYRVAREITVVLLVVGVNQHGQNPDADRYICLHIISFVYVPCDVFTDDASELMAASVDDDTAVCTAETSGK